MFSTIITLVLSLSLIVASPLPQPRWYGASSPPPVIDLGYQKVQGYVNGSLWLWRGIHYASAVRFQAPQTPAYRSEIFNATSFGPVCYQSIFGEEPTAAGNSTSAPAAALAVASEDCLVLNVYAPAGATNTANLPVLVWIHGGGYAAGSAGAGNDWTNFIELGGNNFVVVALQYRLGAFGFLGGKAVHDDGVSNAGLLDQQFALQWVQQHIAQFGGDCTHVTIWGESAGAGSVMNQVIANGGNTEKALNMDKALFQGVIASSVFIPAQFPYNHWFPEMIYQEVVNGVGCGGKDNEFDCLSEVDAVVLANTSFVVSIRQPYGLWVFVPVIDYTFLTDRASVVLASGQINGKSIVAINNADEGYIFTDPTIVNDTSTDTTYLTQQFDSKLAGLFPVLTVQERQAVAAQYTINDSTTVGNTFERISRIIADSTFVCPTYWTAQAFGSNAYKGLFAYPPAHHGMDVSYYQNNIFLGHSNSSVQSFTGALVAAVQTYNPNNNGFSINPSWPLLTSGQQLKFNTTDGLESQAVPELVSVDVADGGMGQNERCAFWRGSISLDAGLR